MAGLRASTRIESPKNWPPRAGDGDGLVQGQVQGRAFGIADVRRCGNVGVRFLAGQLGIAGNVRRHADALGEIFAVVQINRLGATCQRGEGEGDRKRWQEESRFPVHHGFPRTTNLASAAPNRSVPQWSAVRRL
jgi:hypothetical protein